MVGKEPSSHQQSTISATDTWRCVWVSHRASSAHRRRLTPRRCASDKRCTRRIVGPGSCRDARDTRQQTPVVRAPRPGRAFALYFGFRGGCCRWEPVRVFSPQRTRRTRRKNPVALTPRRCSGCPERSRKGRIEPPRPLLLRGSGKRAAHGSRLCQVTFTPPSLNLRRSAGFCVTRGRCPQVSLSARQGSATSTGYARK